MEVPKQLSKSAKKRARQKQKKEKESSQEPEETKSPGEENCVVISKEPITGITTQTSAPASPSTLAPISDPTSVTSSIPIPDSTLVSVPTPDPAASVISVPQTSLEAAFALLKSSLSEALKVELPTQKVSSVAENFPEPEMEPEDKKPEVAKTKEEIMKERKDKKTEKAAKKQKDDGAPCQPEDVAAKDESGKSKSELRAERRAKQEAQRAAKAAAIEAKGNVVSAVAPSAPAKAAPAKAAPASAKAAPAPTKAAAPPSKAAPAPAKTAPAQTQSKTVQQPKKIEQANRPAEKKPARRTQQKLVFPHIQDRKVDVDQLTRDMKVNQENIHPAIIRLGLQYASGVISGSNARAVALLTALKRVIADYSTPEQTDFSRDLESRLRPCISFLEECRPKSVSMGNAIRYVKRQINNTPSDYSDAEAKQHLHDLIDRYIEEHVELAGKAISEEAGKMIEDSDVILTYGFSSLVKRILLEAHAAGKKFRVVVLDAHPHCDGLELLRRLVAARIPTTYMLISAAPYIMPEVTKVLLGAHALLANGNVMSRVGASQVALVAKAHNVPVLVCCETYKFCEKVQTDSVVFKELGDPDDLASVRHGGSASSIANWRQMEKLTLLNLKYDVTPADLVTAVITELAILPCTSVPVVLRVKNPDIVN